MKNNQLEIGTGNATWREKFDLVLAVIVFAFVAFCILLGINAANGADLTAGYTFTSGEQNITHTKLNSLLTGASINTTFFTDKSASTAPATSDTLLLYDGSGFKKITLANLVLNNASLISSRSEDTAPATNDFFLSYDTSASGHKKVSLYTLQTMTSNAAVVATARNLIVTNSSATAITITADEFVAKDANGIPAVLRNVNTSVAITTSGVGGLDTGGEASSTWYYIWLISSNQNALIAGLISASPTAPMLPGGYTFKGLAGAVFNNASGNFVDFQQIGKWVGLTSSKILTNTSPADLDVVADASSTTEVLTGGALTTFRAAVPPIASGIQGFIERTDTRASGTIFVRVSPDLRDTYKSLASQIFSCPTNASGITFLQNFHIPLFSTGANRNFGFSANNTNATWSFYIDGFDLP
jgi:hypothetical protein